MKVAIDGFGPRGRALFRQLQARSALELVAVCDAADGDALGWLARHDSVRGAFPGRCEITDGCLVTGRGAARVLAPGGQAPPPWRALGVDTVVVTELSLRGDGVVERHLAAGAGRVVLAGPEPDESAAVIIRGVNDDAPPSGFVVVTAGSAVANCLAVLASVLDRAFGLECGLATATGPAGGDQTVVDGPHGDARRGRAAALNLVPTACAAAREAGRALPHLAAGLDALSLRTPVAAGTAVELVATLRRGVTVGQVNEALRVAAAVPDLAAVLGVAEDPTVSSDVIGDDRSCLFDPGATAVVADRLVRVLGWCDEDWAGAARICDLLERLVP